jgi:hypothetical protein
MKTLILPFSDTDVDILNFIQRLRSQHKRFRIETEAPFDDPHTIWAFPEPDTDWEKLGMLSNDEDWDSEDDTHWNELFEQTKPSLIL